jgi:Fic family protein
MTDRSGKFKTNLSGEAAYQSFVPSPLPPNPPLKLNGETVDLLVRANRQLALLEGIGTRIPSVNLFITMYVRKEALMSSQIEGTQATLEDVLDPLTDKNANRDITEVVNYIRAVDFAVTRLKKMPLCNRLLREIHGVLLQDVRGREKSSGEFRHSQNWIGGQGSTIKNAAYIPPEPQDMVQAMDKLEAYINTDDSLDVLIRAALIHYQFETIHPFLDGNGRVGRLLVILFLLEKGLLSAPTLYISYFLKMNRTEYYDRLMLVRQKGNYEQWVRFFLQAVHESASDAVASIDMLIALHEKNSNVIAGFGRGKKTALRLFSYLEENPIIEISKTGKALETTFKTVSDAITRFCKVGILVQNSENRRNRTFTYKAYLDILRKGT